MSEPVNAVAAGSNVSGESKANEHEVAPDEDCSKVFEPVIQLAEVKTETGEEDEEVLFKIRSKLFRYSAERGEWKERGTGDVRLLKHKTTSKIRLLMRREKTLKICLNQYVNPAVDLKENVGSDRSWMWQGVDYADGEKDESTLAIRFKDSTNAQLFKEAYDSAREAMRKLATSEPSANKAPISDPKTEKPESGAVATETKASEAPSEEPKQTSTA